jgi:hypothetical protein
MWEYLSQFWDSITEVVLDLGTFTIEWFESVGNAVAGAIGGMFNWLIHYVNDFFILMGWIFSILKELVNAFTLPISYIFNFLKSFTISAFGNPITPDVNYSFASYVISALENIPYWEYIGTILGITISVIAGVSLLKLITNIS